MAAPSAEVLTVIHVPIPRMFRIRISGDSEPAGDTFPTLAEMQYFVGGYVEQARVVRGGEEYHLFFNEDGASIGLPINREASDLYGAPIVGNVWVWHGALPADA
jgi:Domain of unknown function (DUF3846)